MEKQENLTVFVNRHKNGLPNETAIIKIVVNDISGEHIHHCRWEPFDKNQYNENNMPVKGYLGTARVIEGIYSGIGFRAWEQNDSEFILYSIAP